MWVKLILANKNNIIFSFLLIKSFQFANVVVIWCTLLPPTKNVNRLTNSHQQILVSKVLKLLYFSGASNFFGNGWIAQIANIATSSNLYI